MSRSNRIQNLLFVFLLAGMLFVIIPAVLFASSQGGVNGSDHSAVSQTVPSRTPVFTDTSWIPIALHDYAPPTSTPTPTLTPTATLTGTQSGCLPNPPLGANSPAVEAELASTINSYRGDNSLAGYTINDQLMQAARRHAADMVNLDLNSADPHRGTDGSSPSQRITEACYKSSLKTEIVGWGFSSVTAMMDDFWKTSTVHNGILLSEVYDEYGPTYMNIPNSQFTHYWTVTFGSSTQTGRNPEFHCTYRVEDKEAGHGFSISTWQDTPCSE